MPGQPSHQGPMRGGTPEAGTGKRVITQQNDLFDQKETASVRRKHEFKDAGRAQTEHNVVFTMKKAVIIL